MIKQLCAVLFVSLVATAAVRAEDTVFVTLANQLADQASAAVDAATPGDDDCQVPMLRNWKLRGELKDIRTIALQFRDRAAKGKARTLVGKLKVKRLKANMRTANFLAQNGAACGLDAFGPAWEATRETIGAIVAEMCCGDDGDSGDGDKSAEL